MPVIKKQYIVNNDEKTVSFSHPQTGYIEIILPVVDCVVTQSKIMSKIAAARETRCNDTIYLYEIFVDQKRYGAIITYQPLTLLGYGYDEW